MSFLSLGSSKDRYGILIDIGSGSVLMAAIHSSPGTTHPTIVWANREHIALKKIDSIEKSARAVLATLMSAAMKLDKEGRVALAEYAPDAKLTTAQCSISAPWSYTISKTVTVTQDESFEVTERVLDELIGAAKKQVQEELATYSSNANITLEPITQTTMDLLCNGYRVQEPFGEKTNSLQLTQATVVAQDYLTSSLQEVNHKLFPNCSFASTSFMMLLYCSINSVFSHLTDYCIVDVTNEATEIGIVRDGSLTYATHTPFGLFSLARELAESCQLPINEALGYLRLSDTTAIKNQVSPSSQEAVVSIFDAYQEKLQELINETGDSLSIPKKIILHVESRNVELFKNITARAAKQATKVDHSVLPIATEIIEKEHFIETKERIGDMAHDTALLLAAEFFHKEGLCYEFSYS